MFDIFKGALFLNGSSKSIPARVSFEFDSIRFLLEDGNALEANFSMIKISSGGFENRLIEIKAVSQDNNAIICYINPEEVNDFLEAAQRPGVYLDKAQISTIKSNLKNNRIIEFLVNWGFELIIAAILFMVYSFFY